MTFKLRFWLGHVPKQTLFLNRRGRVVRKSAPIKHILLQRNTLLQSWRGFLKINEIICVKWPSAFLSKADRYISCIVVAWDNATKSAVSANATVNCSLMEVIRLDLRGRKAFFAFLS